MADRVQLTTSSGRLGGSVALVSLFSSCVLLGAVLGCYHKLCKLKGVRLKQPEESVLFFSPCSSKKTSHNL